MKILILCTGNSCRSQMAQGFLKSFNNKLQVYSAGIQPAIIVNPNAIKVMFELGIDLSQSKPVNVEKYLSQEFDYVITVCDEANETCPLFTGKVKHRLHMGFPDPADLKGTEEQILQKFRDVRDNIRKQFCLFYKSLKSEL